MPNWDETYSNWLWNDSPVDAGPTILFDIDGVLANAAGRQHYIRASLRDWDSFFAAVGEDPLVEEVARLLDVIDAEQRIVLLTGRPITVLPQTVAWLGEHQLRWDCLIMRESGDYMAAKAFKKRSVRELRGRGLDLRLAFEDDPRNVAMFHSEGVPCVYIHSGYYD